MVKGVAKVAFPFWEATTEKDWSAVALPPSEMPTLSVPPLLPEADKVVVPVSVKVKEGAMVIVSSLRT